MTSEVHEASIVAPTDTEATEWTLVLCAAGFDYRLTHDAGVWTFWVPAADVDAVRDELAAYAAVNRDWPPRPRPEPPAPPPRPASESPYWVGALLIACFLGLGPYTADHPLLRAAAMDVAGVRAGEWWRLATALLVHADVGHLAGNVCALVLLGRLACAMCGSGTAWALILATGVGGNALKCWLFPESRVAIGASTAGFGALGLLAACQAVRQARRWRAAAPAWRAFALPLGAGLAMLALLGTGPRSDLAAHALGMFSGIIAGATLGVLNTPPLAPRTQRLLELATLSLLALAWHAARRAVVGV